MIPTPPRLATRLLLRFLRDDFVEEVSGDLEERFYAVAERKSLWKAKATYWYEVLHYMRPFAIRKTKSSHLNITAMLLHTLLLSFRNFKRYKSSFFINLIGLSTGLACTLLIYLWVIDELHVDKFNDKDSRLFRAMEFRVRSTGVWTSPTTSGPTADALAQEMPEVESTAATTWPEAYTLTTGNKDIGGEGLYAGKDFFKMFSYDLVHGNQSQVLEDKNAIVISEKLALSLFNTTENIIGKTVELEHKDQFHVSGVFKSMPVNATVQFDFVVPFEKFKEGKDYLLTWNSTSLRTFVLLKPGIDADVFNTKIADFIKVKTNNEVTHRTLFLKKYSEYYLYGKYENGKQAGGRITYVKLFSIIAIFILVIACINFMNLSTARASRRIKEVGIKKAVGAGRNGLIFQYLGESLVLTFMSLFVAVVMVVLLLPQFNIITEKHLALTAEPNLILFVSGITLVTGVISGSYPALYLSGFNAATILKGKLTTSWGELFARKGLVVFQFTLSVIFIVSVLVVYKQIKFIQSADLGYEKNNVVLFSMNGVLRDTQKQETFTTEVKNIPGVENASTIAHNMTGHNSGTSGVRWEGKDLSDKTEFENFTVNYGMIETLGIKMATGRSFSKSFSTDTAKIIFNEAAIKFMGLTDPIGKTVTLWGAERQIIGIVKDFNFESLHENVKPIFFRLAPEETYMMMVKLSPGTEKETVAKLQNLFQKMNPQFPFDYHFLDANYQTQYVTEQRVATLSKYFAGLAILISCLGLFGLAAFTAERRIKEIGIRKVLGSSEFGIVYLLSADFTKIVFVAIVIALPVSYYITTFWLGDFAFKIRLQWWYFIGPGLVALCIAWITVGSQAIRAARTNPVNSLKSE